MTIRVTGISSIGTVCTENYLIFHDDPVTAFQDALRYADDEYSCLYHPETLKPIPHSEYKEFETIIGLDLIDDRF